jgi:hypothetical protein
MKTISSIWHFVFNSHRKSPAHVNMHNVGLHVQHGRRYAWHGDVLRGVYCMAVYGVGMYCEEVYGVGMHTEDLHKKLFFQR